MLLNINASAVAEFSNKLEMISRSALPVAVRQTLNKAALDVKTVTMPETSLAPFIHRKPTFFKANSKAVLAQGFEINSMSSLVGFVPKIDSKDTSVEDLEAQENGGEISGRAFIPLADDRVGNSWTGNVKAGGRFRVLKNKMVDSSKSNAVNPEGKFIASVKHAGVGGIVIGNKVYKTGNKVAWKVVSLAEKGKSMVLLPLFAVKAHRLVSPSDKGQRHFMNRASLRTAAKMERYFVELAEKKIARIK